MVDAHDGGYIMTGFGEGRNAATVAFDGILTRVIRCKRQFQIIAEVGDPGGVHEAVNVRVRDPARRRRERCHSQPNGPRGVHWLSFTLCPKDMTGRVSVYLAISVNHAPVPIVDRR